MTNQKLHMGRNFIIAMAAVVAIGTAGCGGKKEGEAKTGTEAAAANASDAKPEKAENWKYSENVDKMTSEKRFFAEVKSTTKINFDFPYEGGSTFTLTVRQIEKKNNVLLSVSKGQFMTSISGDEETLKIKFDEEKPMTVKYTSPSDGSSDVIFIKSEDEIISKLKNAKHIIIETEFYQAGNKQIEFNVEGLKWEHK
jgi:hypothetical protein